MATVFADDDIPSAADLNTIGAGVVEVYESLTERDAAEPEPEAGQLAWILRTGALDLYSGATNGWIEIAQVTERLDIVRKQRSAPVHSDPWRPQLASLETVQRAVLRGISGRRRGSEQDTTT